MALSFTISTTDVVNVGSDATLDDVTAGGFLALVYANVTAMSSGSIYTKGGAGPTGFCQIKNYAGGAAGRIFYQSDRATTGLGIGVEVGNMPNYGANKWAFIGVRYDQSGANGDQEIFSGDLVNPMQEASSYVTQVVGSGANVSDAAASGSVGGWVGNSIGYDGDIAFICQYNVYPTLDQLIEQQFDLTRSVMTAAQTPLFMHLGIHGAGGTGTQRDWSGNGNDGTITGATKADHAPIKIFPQPGLWRGWDAAAATGNPWYAYAQQ